MKISSLLFVFNFALAVSSGLFTNLRDRYKLQVKLPFWKANGANDPIDQQKNILVIRDIRLMATIYRYSRRLKLKKMISSR
jgi:hypothetical protein